MSRLSPRVPRGYFRGRLAATQPTNPHVQPLGLLLAGRQTRGSGVRRRALERRRRVGQRSAGLCGPARHLDRGQPQALSFEQGVPLAQPTSRTIEALFAWRIQTRSSARRDDSQPSEAAPSPSPLLGTLGKRAGPHHCPRGTPPTSARASHRCANRALCASRCKRGACKRQPHGPVLLDRHGPAGRAAPLGTGARRQGTRPARAGRRARRDETRVPRRRRDARRAPLDRSGAARTRRAAAAPRRRRGGDANIPWRRVAATSRPWRRAAAAASLPMETSRAATWTVCGDESRDVDVPTRDRASGLSAGPRAKTIRGLAAETRTRFV